MADVSRLSNSGFLNIPPFNDHDDDEPRVFGKLRCHDLLFRQKVRLELWRWSDVSGTHWFHQAVGPSWQLCSGSLVCFALVLGLRSGDGSRSRSLLLCLSQQPLDGGSSPGFSCRLFLTTSQEIHLIDTVAYRILIYAKFTISFSSIQGRKKTHETEVAQLIKFVL